MGLFSKKEKPRCPICGGEMSLFSGVVVEDGEICAKCESMIRGEFDIEEFVKRKFLADGYSLDDYKVVQSDPIKSLTIAEIRELIEQKEREGAAMVAEMGGEFESMAKVEKYRNIAPKALEVGLKKSKEYKNRVMATCTVVAGEFAKGDTVTLRTGGLDTQTTLLEVLECSNSSTFETVLSANLLEKHRVEAGVSAWIILDVVDGVTEGTIIGR